MGRLEEGGTSMNDRDWSSWWRQRKRNKAKRKKVCIEWAGRMAATSNGPAGMKVSIWQQQESYGPAKSSPTKKCVLVSVSASVIWLSEVNQVS